MAGKKRSERQIATLGAGDTTAIMELETKPKREPYRATGEYRQARCPTCGMAHGLKRLQYPEKCEKFTASDKSFWEWLDEKDAERGLDSDEPFGIIQEVGAGKGHSFRVIGHFSPAEDKDGFYPIVKRRMLRGLWRWLVNGWVTADEIRELLSSVGETRKP